MWGIELVIMAVMIGLNGVFAAYEIALASLEMPRLRTLVNQHRLGAKAALFMKENIEGSLAVVQLGITLVGVIAAATGGAEAAEALVPMLRERFDFSAGLAELLALVIVVIPLTVVTIVFGELIPKVFALRNKEWVCLKLSPGMRVFTYAIWPVVWCLEFIVKGLLRLGEKLWLKRNGEQPQQTSRERRVELQELRASAALARTSRLIGQQAEQIIVEASTLAEHTIQEIMLPAEFISMLNLHDSMIDALTAAHLDLHTRFPVTTEAGNPQAICGYVTFKDMVSLMRTSPKDPSLKAIVRNIDSFPDTLSVEQCLERLIRQHVHIALVRNEDDHILGMITMEDLLEEVVGNIEDEYDHLPTHVVKIGHGWIVGGGVGLEPLREQTEINLLQDPPAPDVRTLSDWISQNLKGPLHGGEIIQHPLARIIVRKSRRHKVLEAFIQPTSQ